MTFTEASSGYTDVSEGMTVQLLLTSLSQSTGTDWFGQGSSCTRVQATASAGRLSSQKPLERPARVSEGDQTLHARAASRVFREFVERQIVRVPLYAS